MKLECEFLCSSDGYTCRVTTAAISDIPKDIKEIKGDHEKGKSNKDVQAIHFENCKVRFIPRGSGYFFSNMVLLEIYNCGLKSICRNDLKEFKNLETLWLVSNELTTLPDDLFEDTPKLNVISFERNKIESMSSKLFDPIINNDLIFIDLRDNTKINVSYQSRNPGKGASLAALMEIIDSQCFKPRTFLKSFKFHRRNFLKNFEDLFESGKFSDFVITVNDLKQFRVHKIVLSAQCGSFAELFEDEPETAEIKVEGLSSEAVEMFLRFLYTGKIDYDVSENYLEIFALAAKLKVSDLKDSIENFIVDHIYNFDALKAFSVAHSFKSDKLKRAAFKEIQTTFPGRRLPENLIDDLERVKEMVKKWKKFESS